MGKISDKPVAGAVEAAASLVDTKPDSSSMGGIVSASAAYGVRANETVYGTLPTTAGRGVLTSKYVTQNVWYTLDPGIWLVAPQDFDAGKPLEYQVWDKTGSQWLSLGTSDSPILTIFAPASGLRYRSPYGSQTVKLLQMGVI